MKGRRVLVIGGGKIATEKIRKVLLCEADIVVITKEVKDKHIEELAKLGKIKIETREFLESDLEGAFIVIAATDNSELNQRVYDLCNSRNIPVNSVDQKDKCSFIFSAEIRKGDLTIAVSTGGASPGLAAKIRNQIEKMVAEDAEIYIEEAKKVREEIKLKNCDNIKKSKMLKEIAEEIDIFSNGKVKELKAKIKDILKK